MPHAELRTEETNSRPNRNPKMRAFLFESSWSKVTEVTQLITVYRSHLTFFFYAYLIWLVQCFQTSQSTVGLQKSGCRCRSLASKPEATVTRKELGETTQGRNSKGNLLSDSQDIWNILPVWSYLRLHVFAIDTLLVPISDLLISADYWCLADIHPVLMLSEYTVVFFFL